MNTAFFFKETALKLKQTSVAVLRVAEIGWLARIIDN
jgi:hypothetical protein